MKFEWDPEKEKTNQKIHGISFYTASKVFLDDNLIEIYDGKHSSTNEDRFCAIGMVDDVLFVVYTERYERIRLISARLATRQERSIYYGNLL